MIQNANSHFAKAHPCVGTEVVEAGDEVEDTANLACSIKNFTFMKNGESDENIPNGQPKILSWRI